MKQVIAIGILTALFMTILTACGNMVGAEQSQKEPISDISSAEYVGNHTNEAMENAVYSVETAISDIINDPVFGDCGRLIFSCRYRLLQWGDVGRFCV